MFGEDMVKAIIALVFVVPLVAGCLLLYFGAGWMKMQDEMEGEKRQ